MGRIEVRVEPDRRAQVLLGARVVLAQEQVHFAEAEVRVRGRGPVRGELEVLLERRVRRLADLAAVPVDLAPADPEPRAGELGVLLDGRAVRRERLVPLLQLRELVGARGERLRRRVRELGVGPVLFGSFEVVVLLEKLSDSRFAGTVGVARQAHAIEHLADRAVQVFSIL